VFSIVGAGVLLAYKHDRVFKEARRRLQENVLEPSVWTKAESETPEEEKEINKRYETIEDLPDEAPELAAASEAEKQKALEKKKLADEEDARLLAEETRNPRPIIDEEEEVEDDNATAPIAVTNINGSTASQSTTLSILEQKLAAPVVAVPSITVSEKPIAEMPTPLPVPTAPSAPIAPPVSKTPLTPPRLPSDSDPYRESID
jgi:hypothetical protein